MRVFIRVVLIKYNVKIFLFFFLFHNFHTQWKKNCSRFTLLAEAKVVPQKSHDKW